ncbi:MAG: hypothetical protein IT204_13850 [Fimbriimonadaceae bacterium]|nr:hypothetical protein [Fimbriimonadaceae bacterium]
MTDGRQRLVAWILIGIAFVGLIPLQGSIDRYRNTFRVSFYDYATDDALRQVEQELAKRGLQPRRTTGRNAEGQEVRLVEAAVPPKEWGKDLFTYVAAVNRIKGVSNVLPSLNDVGMPLDKIQDLNMQDVGIVVMAALLGGFRRSAANVLWLQSDANWYEGRHYRTVPLGRLVTTLDPQFVEAWTVTTWHLAYNMSVEEKSADQAAERIREGIQFCEKGLPWNSTRYELYQEVGWTYYDKLQNYARAAEYFKLALDHPHPTFLERAIAHAYERIPDIESALFWYNVSLKKYGYDPVAQGAVITIQQRYLRAWQAFKQGELDLALRRLKEDWQSDDPFDTIGLHFKARIFEAKAIKAAKDGDQEAAEGFYQQAFQTWLDAAGHNASNRLARRRVLTLSENFWKQWGWKTAQDKVPAGMNDVGLPERRNELATSHDDRAAEPQVDSAEQQPSP